VSVGGSDFAFFGASSEPDQLARTAAGPEKAGIAAARQAEPRILLAAVRAATARDEVVVVYLHWGVEYRSCPTRKQRVTARALAEAGADVIVGSHAHVLLGSGWQGTAYVNYGLGNFLWYHDHAPDSGVLRVRVQEGRVIGDSWVPAEIETFGRPVPLAGAERDAALTDWRRLRSCTDLALRPPGQCRS
jgi:poly-gamma-glutamate synthesis protein (capsule biosynthesis protein)